MLEIVFDVIRKILKWIWGGGKEISRINFNAYNAELKYPTPFIEQHKNAPGVDEAFNKLKKAHDNFRIKRSSVKEKESQSEEGIFNRWKKAHLVKIISKRLFVISLVVSIIGDSLYSNFFTDLASWFGIICVLSIPVLTTSTLIEILMERSYRKHFNYIEKEFLSLRAEYLRINAILEQEMDDLCLASLNELELTRELHRREIEELKNMQRQTNESISSMNKKMSSMKQGMEEIERKARQTTDDLKKVKKKLWIDD